MTDDHEMIPAPPLRLDRDDLVDLFASVIDRPLFLACRATSCSALYYAHAALDAVEEGLAELSRWYDASAPDGLWHAGAAHVLDRTVIAVATARRGAYAAWQHVTDYWLDRREPVRFAAVLSEFRTRANLRRHVGSQVA